MCKRSFPACGTWPTRYLWITRSTWSAPPKSSRWERTEKSTGFSRSLTYSEGNFRENPYIQPELLLFYVASTNKTGNLTYVMKLATDKKVGDLVISSSKDTGKNWFESLKELNTYHFCLVESFDYPLKVIATDYENYLVFWCCHVKDNKSYSKCNNKYIFY